MNPFGLIAGMAASSLLGGLVQSSATQRAAGQQAQSAESGIAEQRRQFDTLQQLLRPYVEAGTPALRGQQSLIGLRGPAEQQAAISQIESSPLLQALTRQGEQAMMQNASATGGLRGGNFQGALAQFRPMMLQNAIDQQYARLGGFTALGQQSAAGVGSAGMETGSNVAQLLAAQGAARAGGTLGGAAPFVQALQMPAVFGGIGIATGKWNPFGGASTQSTPVGLAAGLGMRK